ncbi:alpha/beta hydrolase [Streptomyces sp. NBC_00237]|uniref:alpha/beta hydrolase n=1 Tax=Streptomyces sp. NBC_00237 TaxID=2975687 RepID=UPI002258F7B5|nr:alpha/beta hydrolase [Streptomyces sp. NBC_00237]MCX5201943.1 alpha/beta hydrolase [Streptomyces sp. NBC_00237]
MHLRSAATALTGTALLLAGTATAVRPATAADSPDLARFYDQKLAWGDCEGEEQPKGGTALKGMECSRLTVPIDYANPALGTITLAVGRYRSTGTGSGTGASASPSSGGGDRIGSLVFNFGGPGASGLTTLAEAKDTYRSLGKRYDLVSFDPRGVGRSSPVNCGKEAEEELEDGDGAPQVPPGDAPLDHGDLVKELKDIAAACAQHTGKLLPHVGTINVSRDLDVLRQALGDEKLNYMGISYGTRLGSVYAAQFPDRSGRLVLDAVDTLTENSRVSGLNQARAFQKAFEAFLATCADQKQNCPLGSTTAEATRTVDRVVAALTRKPVRDEAGNPFGVADLRGALSISLYAAQAWPALAQGIADLDQDGDPGILVEINSLADEPGNGEEALIAVNCADDPDRGAVSEKELATIEKEFTEASPVFGRDMVGGAISCTGWPAGTDYIRNVENVSGPQVLLIGTKGDPATPYRWTEETARRLGNAVVLQYDGEGHGAYGSSPCIREKTDAYLVDGTLPADGTACPAVPPGEPGDELPETLPGT